jgi:hypothetical protein
MIRKLFLVIVMNAFVADAGRCQTMSMDECMAYDGMKAKYEKGLASAIDLQTTATLLLQAEAECLYTGLRYVAQQRMADYYGGKPLIRK